MTEVKVSQRWQIKTAAEVNATDFANWQQLVEQQHQGNLMLSGSFVQHLMQVFQPRYYLASCYQADELKVMLLLQPAKYGIWRLVQPSQAQSALIVGAQHFQPDFALLLASLPGLAWRFDFFCLDPLDHAAVIALLQDHSIEKSLDNIQVSCLSSFEDYWQQRSKNLRKNIHRYENRLRNEEKTFEFSFHSSLEEVTVAVDRYGILESQGWKGKNGTSVHPSNLQGVFYQRFLAQLCNNNQSLVIELFIDGQLAASRLCCFNKNMFIILKTAYDENLKAYAPGRLLLMEVIRYVFENKLAHCIDFYTNATEEQIEWSSILRAMFAGSFYRWRLLKKIEPSFKFIKKKLN
jgi:hypothetical protein